MDLPIISEWSYTLIRISPARFKGSVYENNMIILAHNYEAHFVYLYKLVRGEEVEFVDMNDNHFIYNVKDVEKIRKDKMNELLLGNWDLTLFTCNLDGKFRIVVRCKTQK